MLLSAPLSLDDLAGLINCLESLNISCQLQFGISCMLFSPFRGRTREWCPAILGHNRVCSFHLVWRRIYIMSTLVTSCDREYSFVWLPRFISNMYRDLSCDFRKDVVSNYLFYLGSFHRICFINCKLLIYSMMILDSITCSTVVSNPSFLVLRSR